MPFVCQNFPKVQMLWSPHISESGDKREPSINRRGLATACLWVLLLCTLLHSGPSTLSPTEDLQATLLPRDRKRVIPWIREHHTSYKNETKQNKQTNDSILEVGRLNESSQTAFLSFEIPIALPYSITSVLTASLVTARLAIRRWLSGTPSTKGRDWEKGMANFREACPLWAPRSPQVTSSTHKHTAPGQFFQLPHVTMPRY